MRATRRPRRSRAQWQRLMADYEASGQSQQVFCREHGLALSTFARWRRILAGRPTPAAAPSDEPSSVFTELTVPLLSGGSVADAPPWEVELALGAGMVLRIRRSEPC